jgi:hypothetical protein
MGRRFAQSGSYSHRGLAFVLSSLASPWKPTAKLFLCALFWVSLVQAAPFQIARVHYDGGGDWYADPSSLPNLMRFMKTNTGLIAEEKEAVVRLDEAALFQYPLLYMTGHGNLFFTKTQAERLRLYLEQGGFLFVDDNYGFDRAFRREISKVFPQKRLELLPFTHSIYTNFFDYSKGLPKIHEHDNEPPAGYGLFHEGRLVLFYSHESDLGDGWEDARVHKDPESVRQQALEMGSNVVLHVLGVRSD